MPAISKDVERVYFVPHSVSNLLGGDLSLLGRKTDTTFAEGVLWLWYRPCTYSITWEKKRKILVRKQVINTAPHQTLAKFGRFPFFLHSQPV